MDVEIIFECDYRLAYNVFVARRFYVKRRYGVNNNGTDDNTERPTARTTHRQGK